jgi:hypothetical protein
VFNKSIANDGRIYTQYVYCTFRRSFSRVQRDNKYLIFPGSLNAVIFDTTNRSLRTCKNVYDMYHYTYHMICAKYQ